MATQKKIITKPTKPSEPIPSKQILEKPSFDYAFERINYIWMLIGIALLALGYILLIGGGSKNPDVFNESLFDAQRLIVSPILMVCGIFVEIYAILLIPKKNKEQETKE